MWITFCCLLSILYRFFVLVNFFLQVVQTTFCFLIFAFFNIATNSEIPQTTAAKQHAPFHPKPIFSNKESACGLSARERCLKGKLLLRELRILPEGFALQEEFSHVNVTRSFLQSKKSLPRHHKVSPGQTLSTSKQISKLQSLLIQHRLLILHNLLKFTQISCFIQISGNTVSHPAW